MLSRTGCLAAMLIFALSACTEGKAPQSAVQALEETPSNLHALLLNGGGRKSRNYYSHLDHLRRMVDRLHAAGLGDPVITIFASDGVDPELDLATRDGTNHPDFWLLPESGIGRDLRPPIVYRNSTVEGFALLPATVDALTGYFEGPASELAAGDTLLFYVTDHGNRGKEDVRNATISLWNEDLAVSELRVMLDGLDPDVRVVMVMSQCFSGSFANVIIPEDHDPDFGPWQPRGNVCGYFAASDDRKASGCYPEVSGKKKVGHSHRVFEALARVETLPEVQREVLLTDRTPDVPNVSSDLYLRERLEFEATKHSLSLDEFVDAELESVLREQGQAEALAELDVIANSFGFAEPRSLAALAQSSEALQELSRDLQRFKKRWQLALDALRRENLRLFNEVHPEWAQRLISADLRELAPDEKSALVAELMVDLVPFTQEDPERWQRLRDLERKRDDARQARYRCEVRIGVVLRLRLMLIRTAAESYLSRAGTEEDNAGFERLQRCEDFSFSGGADSSRERPVPEAFGTLSQERALLEAVSPAWLGVSYKKPSESIAELGRGPVVVTRVVSESPAEKAGLRVGDILLGSSAGPFAEPHAVREFVMQSPMETSITLRIRREEEEREVDLVLEPFPLVIPEIPETKE